MIGEGGESRPVDEKNYGETWVVTNNYRTVCLA